MLPTILELTSEVHEGTPHSSKRLDKFDPHTSQTLEACFYTLLRDFKLVVNREFIIRRAVRVYLNYLKRDCTSIAEEFDQLILAAEGKPTNKHYERKEIFKDDIQ